MADRKCDVGARESKTTQPFVDMAEFRSFRAQKLAARRCVEEKIMNLDGGARWMCCGMQLPDDTLIDFDLPGRIRIGRSCAKGQPRYRCDAGQRLSAEAERNHRFEIVEAGNLAGCVT